MHTICISIHHLKTLSIKECLCKYAPAAENIVILLSTSYLPLFTIPVPDDIVIKWFSIDSDEAINAFQNIITNNETTLIFVDTETQNGQIIVRQAVEANIMHGHIPKIMDIELFEDNIY